MGAAPRLFTYVVVHDFGFAPNPFGEYCTLATCKPQIRKSARPGDWVLGTGSAQKRRSGRLVFAMKVSEVLTFDEYWSDIRFQRKIPFLHGSRKRVYGDNIYHRAATGEWIQEDSRHSLDDGTPNLGHIKIDTKADAVLISDEFVYFGKSGPEVPDSLRTPGDLDLVHSGRGHSINFGAGRFQAALDWITTLGTGVHGRPGDWP